MLVHYMSLNLKLKGKLEMTNKNVTALGEMVKKDIIKISLSINPNANKEILDFIGSFVTLRATDAQQTVHIQDVFCHGYCYYFALMLKDSFPPR